MAEIGSGDPPSWPGGPDTNTNKESAATQATSDFANDVGDHIINIKTILGLDPHGGPSGANDVAARLDAEHTATGTHAKLQKWAKGADIPSQAALAPGTDGNYFDVTGTTAITSIASLGIGTVIRLHFDDIVVLTHHATDLILPHGNNIVTAAGHEYSFVEYATGDWRMVSGATVPLSRIVTSTPWNRALHAGATGVAVASFNIDLGTVVAPSYLWVSSHVQTSNTTVSHVLRLLIQQFSGTATLEWTDGLANMSTGSWVDSAAGTDVGFLHLSGLVRVTGTGTLTLVAHTSRIGSGTFDIAANEFGMTVFVVPE